MAFNFNWSPLLADTSRAREMLTSALNKSPKPPIIVDDIVVTELNLGTTPPELEILEIGDLAEDRFRGIFRMKYSGDAFLTLKTRVQANPLNTFLSDKPDFASPRPLAAASGLTIPIAITLSEIKLSGFVILVFSKQKGITLVFRNDPLESLKVSSTFDSISFVRNYLQRQIEGQLRVLFMDDLPAIIHKLSLRIWSSEHQDTEAKSNSNRVEDSHKEEQAVDPLATPSQRPFDEYGHPIDETDFSNLSPETREEEPYLHFSTKNLLRLAALSDSNRTLSLFTPSIKDVVFRAWTGSGERAEFSGGIAPISSATLATLSGSRVSSTRNSASSVAGASDAAMTTASAPMRPPLSTTSSLYGGAGGSSISGGKPRMGHGRKRKNRVVDLRKKREQSVEESDEPKGETRSTTPTSSSAPSSQLASQSMSAEGIDDELETPPQSPENSQRLSQREQDTPSSIYSPVPSRGSSARKAHQSMLEKLSIEEASPSRLRLQRSQTNLRHADADATIRRPKQSQSRRDVPALHHSQSTFGTAAEKNTPAVVGARGASATTSPISPGGGILEQAWMHKIASEVAQKANAEKNRGQAVSSNFWTSPDPGDTDPPPPAYAA